MKPLSTDSFSRDARVDFIRGVALLILFSDHVRGNVVAQYTPIAVGLSDMSDVFVFLSGYSCGVSYGRRLGMSGFLECVKRAWIRAGQIFVVKVVVTALALVIIVLTGESVTPRFFGIHWDMKLVRQHPCETLLQVEMFRLELLQVFVLALYIPFLLILPVVVLGLSRRRRVTFLMSAVIYAVSQVFPEYVTLPEPWRGAMFFNPFAWQFLFVSACNLGMMKSDDRASLRPRYSVSVLAAIVLFIAVVVHWHSGLPDVLLVDKRNLGVIRLGHFAAVVIAGWRLVPASLVLSDNAIIRPFIICGRYPLVGYCAGGMLAILGEAALSASSYMLSVQLVVNLVGWGGCLVATSLWGIIWRAKATSGGIAGG